MKKISSTFVNNHEYISRPFALVRHEHINYLEVDSPLPIEISTDIRFTGTLTGNIPSFPDAPGITDGYVLTAENELAVWSPAATGGDGDYNLDGGRADSVYTVHQLFNGGGA